MLKVDLSIPIPWNPPQRLRIGYEPESRMQEYIVEVDGLHFIASADSPVQGGLAVPVEQFGIPQMRRAFQESGLSPEIIEELQPGDILSIEHASGIFIGLVNTLPELQVKALLDDGVCDRTTVNGEVIYEKSRFY